MRSAIPGRVRASSLLTGHLRFCEVVSDRLSRAKVEAKVLRLVYTWDRARSAFESFARTCRSTCAGWRPGNAWEVTERGMPVAILAPLSESSSPLQRLVSSGRARPPQGDLLDLASPRGPVTTKGSDALRELREDRR